MTDRWTLRLVLTRSQLTAPAPVVQPAATVQEAESIGATFSTISDGGLNYRLASFPASGSLVVTGGDLAIEYLIVGGGGAGGTSTNRYGSGGGAGGVLSNLGVPSALAVGSYPVIVGVGATPDPGYTGLTPANGGASSFAGLVAFGGSSATDNQHSRTGGGSAGGSMNILGAPTEGTTGQGHAGGAWGTGTGYLTSGPSYRAGGGGGAGGVGISAIAGGHGGPGLLSTITGTEVYFGGGGGSGCSVTYYPGGRSLGGIGGGGDGAGAGAGKSSQGAGVDGLGGGGGGGCERYASSANIGGRGGNGVIHVRWRI